MTLPQSFASVRHYYFRALIADIERDTRQWGGRSLDAFTLDNFRPLWSSATSMAVDWRRAITNRYDPVAKAWDRPFRRIENGR